MNSTSLLAPVLAIALLSPSLPAMAAPTPMSLVQRVLDNQGTVTYTGQRIQTLTRQALALKATMRISYQDPQNYRVQIQEPSGLSGVNLWLRANRANVYFPAENLLFSNDNPTGSNEAAATIFGTVSTDPGLLPRNYSLRILSDAEAPNNIVALMPCYVLDAEPLRGYVTPGHRFWISRDSYQVLKEERTWGRGMDPYFVSYFDEYLPTPKVDTQVGLPKGNVNAVQLQQDQKNSFVQYRTIEEASRAIGEPVPLPSYVPSGFKLSAVQFATFFGTRITLLHYTDGLNWLFVTYRPKPNMFLTMMAGAMALGLVDKMSQLSYQAPFNYFGAEVTSQLAFAYGDLYPDDLQKVVGSLNLAGGK